VPVCRAGLERPLPLGRTLRCGDDSKADKIYITYGAAHFPGFFAELQRLDPQYSIRSIKGVRPMVLPDEPNLAPSAVSGSKQG